MEKGVKLPNEYFRDVPIEFKQINPTDFDNNLYNTSEKIIVEPNKDGYLSDNLIPILKEDLQNKNTTIINAGVGQGKTTALMQMVSEYINTEEFIVVIAVPYNALIEQYETACLKIGISEKKIFNLLKIDELLEQQEIKTTQNYEDTNWGFTSDDDIVKIHEQNENKFKISNCKIHILTVNSLLGNSGYSLFQSSKKHTYFKKLETYCKKQNKKLVILFDEIHDAIHNFEERYIYSFWKYQNLIHKNYIISATFNEASKEVIKYLSEFTDRNIKIIESKRIRIPQKQSRLHLHFYLDEAIEKNEALGKIISNCHTNDKDFDILCYSKTLADKLIKNLTTKSDKEFSICSIPKEKINKCFTNTFKPQETKRYNKGLINIGTNFSTGVNIEEENHTYIILLPKNLNIQYFNNKGIFTSGSNTIIQALARQRKKGDIYIFTEKPKVINPTSLPSHYNEEQKNSIIDCFNKRQSFKGDINYSDINLEHKKLQEAYNKLIFNLQEAKTNIEKLNRVSQMNRLEYPPQEIFNLNLGEKYLANNFFGGDLSSFILWSAITNQFLNCSLDSVELDETIFLSSKNLDEDLKKKVTEYLYYFEFEFIDIEEIGKIERTYFEKIQLLKEYFYINKVIVDDKALSELKKREILLKAINVLLFDQPFTPETKKQIKKNIYHDYIFGCVSSAKNIDLNSTQVKECIKYNVITKEDIDKIKILKSWCALMEVINKHIEPQGKFLILSEKGEREFKAKYNKLKFNESIKYLIENDLLLSTSVFQFKNTISKLKNDEFYKHVFKLTLEVFYKVQKKKIKIHGKNMNKDTFKSKELSKLNKKGYLLKTLPTEILKLK